jgi:tetratricopeptide (TPR) repeat protein
MFVSDSGRTREIMELLSTVNKWIDNTRERIAKEEQIPLIDSLFIDMTSELVDAWMLDDTPLREALENVLSRDPADTATRLLTLGTYYQLMTLAVPERKDKREEFRRQLAYFVRLRDIDHCTTLPDIRWEITNACSINDHQRALALCGQLQSIVPALEHHYLTGRLHFLIALAHTWGLEESLAHWDLPFGPKPQGLRGISQGINFVVIYMAGLNQIKTNATITEDDRDHLRDAIKHLERAESQQLPPAARFMLARSYTDIEDHHNAATVYQWMLDHSNELLAAGATEAGPVWNPAFAENILSGIYECLAGAYERDGAIEKAIATTTACINALPEQLGTYERLARLHQAKGDYHAAYDWLRKEADRNPTLSEDPNVSIALALGSISAATNIDDTLTTIASTHQDEQRRIADLMLEYWPTYKCLSEESRKRWATGAWLQSTTIPHAPGLAAHSFAWVVERELRTTIIDRFRASVTPANFNTDEEEAKFLQRYLRGYGGLSLGQMLTVIERSMRSRNPLLATFGQWLKREYTWLGAGLQRLRTDKMIALRNREDHADLQTIKTNDLVTMARTCKELLNLLHTTRPR